MKVNGYRIDFNGGGLLPQLRGWYVCDPGDIEHKACRGPFDTEAEAIKRGRDLPDLNPDVVTKPHMPGEG